MNVHYCSELLKLIRNYLMLAVFLFFEFFSLLLIIVFDGSEIGKYSVVLSGKEAGLE